MSGPSIDPPPPAGDQGSDPQLFDVGPGVHEPLADLAVEAGTALDVSGRVKRRWSAYLALAIAIVAGVTGTSALSATAGFTRLGPTLLVGVAYLACFIALTRALKAIEVSIVYAIWSGVGIALITAIGWAVFDQKLGLGQIAGLGMIAAGVIVIHLYSRTKEG